MKIGIIGIGMVGGQVMRWFKDGDGTNRIQDLFCYDRYKKKYCDDISFVRPNIVFICVPTPSNPDGSCDISILEMVVEYLPDSNGAVVIKSTVPPGTTVYLQKKYKSKGYFFFNPEFLTEANAWEDFIHPDRQIVAPADKNDKEVKKWTKVILSLLPSAPFQSPSDKWCIDSTEAELGKYAANLFGSMKVVFFNILANRCKILRADFENVRQVVINDERIGPVWTKVPYNGYSGYGGYCFIKDTDASIASDEKILKTLSENDFEKIIFSQSIEFFKAMRLHNKLLLASQGLTPEDVSVHNAELKGDKNV